ncbi:hypothetical protein TIFTF001_029975 [Ficus carica]|uniref:Uncharacterized protein n=1 Tax=Ficus carica TaxID=3494 RepID=A0AA88IYX1_FICCA|nr:hypothetical protein TIFTF001_029975 [Ficus carica]
MFYLCSRISSSKFQNGCRLKHPVPILVLHGSSMLQSSDHDNIKNGITTIADYRSCKVELTNSSSELHRIKRTPSLSREILSLREVTLFVWVLPLVILDLFKFNHENLRSTVMVAI